MERAVELLASIDLDSAVQIAKRMSKPSSSDFGLQQVVKGLARIGNLEFARDIASQIHDDRMRVGALIAIIRKGIE